MLIEAVVGETEAAVVFARTDGTDDVDARITGLAGYTTSLFRDGLNRMAQKVGEEAVETALAAMSKDHDELINESADLLFHLTVLLRNEKASWAEVVKCLENRHKDTSLLHPTTI